MTREQADHQLVIVREYKSQLVLGFAKEHKLDPALLAASFPIEWRGRYGFVPGVYIWQHGQPIASMTPLKAQGYIRSML